MNADKYRVYSHLKMTWASTIELQNVHRQGMTLCWNFMPTSCSRTAMCCLESRFENYMHIIFWKGLRMCITTGNGFDKRGNIARCMLQTIIWKIHLETQLLLQTWSCNSISSPDTVDIKALDKQFVSASLVLSIWLIIFKQPYWVFPLGVFIGIWIIHCNPDF